MANFRIGDLITFTYNPLYDPEGDHDKFPQVWVLHNGWQGKVHGLNFNLLTPDEINMFKMFVDTGFRLRYVENLYKKNPQLVQVFETILAKAELAHVTSPRDFYFKVIRPFIMTRGWEPYRQYRIERMNNVRVVDPRQVLTGENRNGDFGVKNVRDHGKNEKEILKELAQKQVQEDAGSGEALTLSETKFINGLRGAALRIFDDFVRKFEYNKGPRLPTFNRR